mgnify:CR=1 FL=1
MKQSIIKDGKKLTNININECQYLSQRRETKIEKKTTRVSILYIEHRFSYLERIICTKFDKTEEIKKFNDGDLDGMNIIILLKLK